MGMIQMVQVNWRSSSYWCRLSVYSFVAVLVLSVFAPTVVDAKTKQTKVRLDAATIELGYTVTLGKTALGIQPDTFSEPVAVWLRRKKTSEALPETLAAVSKVTSYTVLQSNTGVLDKPVWLSYQFTPTDLTYDRSFYYFDSAALTWKKIPSTLDQVAGTVTAAWPFPHSEVVVADDTTDLLAPELIDATAKFGTLAADAAIVIDNATGEVLYAKSAYSQRSLASLTKLMTATVLLEQGIDLDKVVTYHSSYDQIGARLYVNEGEQMTNRDLLYAMVVGSANNAAYALIGDAGYTVDEFVGLMNEQAADFGLTDTTFADPSGLAVENYSTAYDYAQLMRQTLANEELAAITHTDYYSFTTINTGVFHDFPNTNHLIATSDLNITGSKTGYIDEAGYCLAMRVQSDDHAIVSVVLGAATSTNRFNESERLVDWVLDNYQW